MCTATTSGGFSINPANNDRLAEIFATISNESLTEAEHHELCAILRSDAEARQVWFLYQDVELGLRLLTQRSEETATSVGTADKMPAETVINSPSKQVDRREQRQRSSWVGRLRRQSSVVLAIGFLTLAISVFVFRDDRSRLRLERPLKERNSDDVVRTFVVESPTHGNKFVVPETSAKVIALHFLLKTECPNCLKLVHDYALLTSAHPEILHLFLKPDDVGEIRNWASKINREGLQQPPTIYQDPNARLAQSFGIPDGYLFHGERIHFPALVAIDSTGKELFRYVGVNNTDRMRPEDFLTKLAMSQALESTQLHE